MTLRAFKRARIVNTVHVVHDGTEALDFLFARGAYEVRREKAMPGVILPRFDVAEDGWPGSLAPHPPGGTDARHPGGGADFLALRKRPRGMPGGLGINSYIVKPVDFRNFSEVTPQLHFDWQLIRDG